MGTQRSLNQGEMSRVLRKPAFCIYKNRYADQLRGNREADRRLCFRYMDSKIPLLPKYKHFKPLAILCGCSLVCPGVGPGRKPRRPVFSQRGSNYACFHGRARGNLGRYLDVSASGSFIPFCHRISVNKQYSLR